MRALVLLIAFALATELNAEESQPSSPAVPGYGAVMPLPNAAEQPRRQTKIVFDITSDGEPDKVIKGLENVARYLNLNAQAGNAASDVRLALVLHGTATKGALNDTAYASRTQAKHNPNLALVRELKKHGVEVFVCGQSLARNKYATAEVASEFTVAVSAMTVNANKQQDGYAYIFIH
jgi:intracellular sulfur oxidation DsrE/DsrF family protein